MAAVRRRIRFCHVSVGKQNMGLVLEHIFMGRGGIRLPRLLRWARASILSHWPGDVFVARKAIAIGRVAICRIIVPGAHCAIRAVSAFSYGNSPCAHFCVF